MIKLNLINPQNEDVFVGYVDSYGHPHLRKTFARKDKETSHEVAGHATLFSFPGKDRFVFWPEKNRLDWFEAPSRDSKVVVTNHLERRFQRNIKSRVILTDSSPE